MFEGVLPVLLLGAHVLLQQAEDVAGLQGTRREDKMRDGEEQRADSVAFQSEAKTPKSVSHSD